MFYFALPIMVSCIATVRFNFTGSDPDRPFVSEIIRKVIDKPQHSGVRTEVSPKRHSRVLPHIGFWKREEPWS